MPTFADELEEQMRELMFADWNITKSDSVPSTEDVALKNGAVRIKATYLYADLADSTLLQKRFKDTFAAKVMRMYLHGACKIIRNQGGHIKSFDGDRVMAIFVGGQKSNDAANAALKISWLVDRMINPVIKERLEATKTTAEWTCSHGIGIDAGEALVVRAGVRNSSGNRTHNDLISIGRAPNVAAKLSARRTPDRGPIWITNDVHSVLEESQRLGGPNKENMWESRSSEIVGPYVLNLHRSGWMRKP